MGLRRSGRGRSGRGDRRARRASAPLPRDAPCPSLGLDDGLRRDNEEPVLVRPLPPARRAAGDRARGPVTRDVRLVSHGRALRVGRTCAKGRRAARPARPRLGPSYARRQPLPRGLAAIQPGAAKRVLRLRWDALRAQASLKNESQRELPPPEPAVLQHGYLVAKGRPAGEFARMRSTWVRALRP